MLVKLVENESALTKELAYILSKKLYNLKNMLLSHIQRNLHRSNLEPNDKQVIFKLTLFYMACQ